MLSKFLLLCVLSVTVAQPQPNLAGAAKIRLSLDQLRALGSVLMIAAHPDDENTALLAYFARGRKMRAGYLSLTRGEGGQNLIGPEQGDLLGLIRTQELLEARRIDGAEQFFSRAIDFGYSKTAEETLRKWGRDEVLGDVVWIIRKFRPDVVILRFSGTPRDGHGHHQSSAMLGKEAYAAAGDPKRYPEQLKWVRPWQPKRLLWNAFGFTPQQEQEAAKLPARVEFDAGQYDPVLGYSYAEIAGMSRSQHRSQGFGAAQRRGPARNYLTHVAGEPAVKDALDGVDTTWNRLPGGAEIDRILGEAGRGFDAATPWATVPLLLKARPLIAAIQDPWAVYKLTELDEAIALCAGLWLDAVADRYAAEPGSVVKVRAEAINRSPLPMWLTSVGQALGLRRPPRPPEGEPGQGPAAAQGAAPLLDNQPITRDLTWKVPGNQPYSMPFWLAPPKQGERYGIPETEVGIPDQPPLLTATFRLRVGSEQIELRRPVRYRYVDRVGGEMSRPLVAVPRVAVKLAEPVLLFPNAQAKTVEVELKANVANASGTVRLEAPQGWRVEPASRPFQLAELGEQATAAFELLPGAGGGRLRAIASAGGQEIDAGTEFIVHEHIEPQAVFPPAAAKLVRSDIRVLAKKVGYIMGAGDEVPRALRQLGCDVTELGPGELARGDLGGFDAIVTGVRAYNTRPDLRANNHRLLDYVKGGGTLLVQYNVADFGAQADLGRIGPYPLRIGRDRVSVEEAPVSFPNPKHTVLLAPNRIGPADFDGWVQERGLYFASEWDSQYEPLFESHDPGEPPRPGGTLVARYGNGVYVFTAYSWFRQLPAGVEGAYRIFANLLSSGKTLR